VTLVDLPRDIDATVHSVEAHDAHDAIARRLRELGFVAGERVRVTAFGPFTRDPLVVRVGTSAFALRRTEAARIRVSTDEMP